MPLSAAATMTHEPVNMTSLNAKSDHLNHRQSNDMLEYQLIPLNIGPIVKRASSKSRNDQAILTVQLVTTK